MTQQKKYQDYGAAWEKQNQYGTMISLSLPVEFVQQLLNTAVNGKVWVSLGQNTKKQPGSKQPDWRVLPPREQQQQYTAPAKRWEPTDNQGMTEEDVPF